MRNSLRIWSVAFLVLVTTALVLAQPVRKDAIWARTVPTGTITLDGKLSEAAWSQTDSMVLVYGQDFADPTSGYRDESGMATPNAVNDPTTATVKFLVMGDSLYMALICKDNSIGGGPWAHFDAFLGNIKNKSSANRPVPPFEIFYGWVAEGWADTTTAFVGSGPGFFGQAGNSGNPNHGSRAERSDSLRKVWDAVTVVHGTTNTDATADTNWVTEFKFNLGRLGYTVSSASGDIVMMDFSVWDADNYWPIDSAKFTSNRTWWQGPWGNANSLGHFRIFAKPSVTTSSGTPPAFGYDLVVPNGTNFAVPTVDGQLNDAIWSKTPGFDIRYGDVTLRNSYKTTGPFVSGQYQPTVDGQTNAVVDPGDCTVKMFFKADTLYIGIDVRDQGVQYRPEYDRWDGIKVTINDRSARDVMEHRLLFNTFTVRVDSSAKHYALEDSAKTFAADGRGKFALALKAGTTVDTLGSDIDAGYQIEMAISLTALGYPAGRGDGALYEGITLFDGDPAPTGAYGTRTWWFRENGDNDGAAFVYMDPNTLVTSVEVSGGALPASFEVLGNYPNPFNPSTNIRFSLPQMSSVRLIVFDILGRRVSSEDLGPLSAGTYDHVFSAARLASGVYYYQLQMLDAAGQSPVQVRSGKMTLLK